MIFFFGPIILVMVVLYLLYKSLYSEGPKADVRGAVFVSGCDSGIGERTVIHLAGLGFRVYAGIYLKESFEKWKGVKNVIPVELDVTNEERVKAAAEFVRQDLGIEENQELDVSENEGLIGLVNCAGVGFTGPVEYFGLENYRRCMDINFMGYVCTTQQSISYYKNGKYVSKKRKDGTEAYGRIVYTCTGGGVPGTIPAVLSAYMASKWAVDAFSQTLRLEMKLTSQNINSVIINPGIIKPTGLSDGGKLLLKAFWKRVPDRAREVYGDMIDCFVQFNERETGTHPSFVASAIESALRVSKPPLRYKVGVDSKASPIVGLLPTQVREYLVSTSMFDKSKLHK